MKKVKITEATDEQLKWFATNVQQIANVPSQRGPLIAALIESGHEGDFISVESSDSDDTQSQIEQFEEPEEQVAEMPTAGFGYWRDSPMVTLRVMPTDRPGGNEPAHPSINGSPALVIQRSKLVRIPYDFYLVLKQAGGTKIIPGEKPTDPLIEINYSEYPMNDVVLPSREAIAAWRKRTSEDELGRPKARATA